MFKEVLKENLFLFLAFALGSFLYIYKLESIPYAIHGDEAETALQAIEIIKGNTGLIGVGWFDVPLLSFAPHAASMILLGENTLGNRVASAFFGLATIPFYFLLTQILLDKKIAIVSSLLFSTSHLWLALSRIGMQYTQAAFLVVISLYLTIVAVKKKNFLLFLLAGIFTGFCFYSYFATRIIVFLVLIIFLLNLEKKAIKKWVYSALFFIFGFILILLPQLLFYSQNINLFSSRENTVFVFNETGKKWAGFENLPTNEILLKQTTGALNIFKGDNSSQYGYKGQLFDYFSIAFFFMGIFFLKNYLKTGILIFSWFLLSIAGQILTTIPSPIFLPRFIVGLPALFILIGLGFVNTYSLVRKNTSFFYINFICSFIIFFVVLWNLKIYFLNYPLQIAGDNNARTATRIGKYLNSLENNYVAYFRLPSITADYRLIHFLSREGTKIELNEDKIKELYVSSKKFNKSLFLLHPDDSSTINLLKRIFPNAKFNYIKEINGSPKVVIIET